MQERRNSIANTLELRLSCTHPSIYRYGSIVADYFLTHPSDRLIQANEDLHRASHRCDTRWGIHTGVIPLITVDSWHLYKRHLRYIMLGIGYIILISIALFLYISWYCTRWRQTSRMHEHIEPETKWPTFSRRPFQMHFLEWKCFNWD